MDVKLKEPSHRPFYHESPPPPPHHEHHPGPIEEKKFHQPPPVMPHKQRQAAQPIIKSLILGTLLTALIGLALYYFHVKLEIILPVLAPIWVGSITLIYSFLKER